MNANELADKIEDARNETDFQKWAGQAPDMLRQQQAEIAELKHMNRNWQISENILLLELEKLQHRELTDEEIGQFKGEWYRGDYASFYDLVRAILRKAQE